MVELPVVYSDRCNGCGLCIGVCSGNALVLTDKGVTIIETAECDWCLKCEAVCPTGAIACPFEIVIEEHSR